MCVCVWCAHPVCVYMCTSRAHACACCVSACMRVCLAMCVRVSVCVLTFRILYPSKNRLSAYVTFHVISMFFFKHYLQCGVIPRLVEKNVALFYTLCVHSLQLQFTLSVRQCPCIMPSCHESQEPKQEEHTCTHTHTHTNTHTQLQVHMTIKKKRVSDGNHHHAYSPPLLLMFVVVVCIRRQHGHVC